MQSRYRSGFTSVMHSSMSGVTKRHLSSSAVTSAEKKRKIVVIGAGFVGKLAKRLVRCLMLIDGR